MSALGGKRTVRLGPVSGRVAPRTLFVAGVALVVAAAVAVAALASGDLPIAPTAVLEALAGGGDRRTRLIVIDLRLARVVLGALTGVMLGLAGAIVQTTTRNGLASPDLLGVSAGAGAGALVVLVLAPAGSALAAVGVPFAALIGGLVAAATVALLLRFSGGSGLQVLLIGVGVSAFYGGLTSWLLITASIDDLARANAWLAGSLNERGAAEAVVLAAALLLVAVLLIPLATRLPALELGPDVATALGHRTGWASAGLLLCAVALTSVTVAMVGPIGFIALVAPHLARLACGTPRPPLAVTGLIGAALVLASDLAARRLFAPLLLPTGAVTAMVGAPFLIWLLISTRKGLAR
ncbi:transporter permease [Enemella evansiae]|uniref:FecCD family ABC transporter permease n=1 Tax=Enemella evansiae TaxID=2016499 RepID=UPI000B9715A2|nr:iron chelate uptake ABC transporter family permease subunit [Enemella evansiae]OYN95724.1 transporter permease [Enemella evansiae]